MTPLPWPKAPPTPPWRQRAAARLAMLRKALPPTNPPPYAGDPTNIQRATFGQTAGDHELNRIYQVMESPPIQAETPMYIWPRGTAWLGR